MTRVSVLIAALLGLLASSARAERTLYVDASAGDDAGNGSARAPWPTLTHMARAGLRPGDTVIVRAGRYRGFYLEQSGTAAAPIAVRAEDGVVIDRDNPETPDGINLEGAAHVRIDNFEIVGVSRAGIRVVHAAGVVLRGNRIRDSRVWGILTGFCDDILIEDNDTSGSREQHGIYVSNSGDRPTVRGNRIWNNRQNGLHMNGDAEMGGDGVISGALVENNRIWGNGRGGGSAINADGVQGATIRNNLLHDNHATGIGLYRINGGAPSIGNTVVHNTVIMAADARYALLIRDASTGNTVVNNALLTLSRAQGSFDVWPDSLAGLRSDHNLLSDVHTLDDWEHPIDLATWRARTGQDAHSRLVRDPAQAFAGHGRGDLMPSAGGPAIDGADRAVSVATDALGRARGQAPDIGALELADARPAAGSRARAEPAAEVEPGAEVGAEPEPGAEAEPEAPRASQPARHKGCAGCASGGGAGAWLGLAIMLPFLRRR